MEFLASRMSQNWKGHTSAVLAAKLSVNVGVNDKLALLKRASKIRIAKESGRFMTSFIVWKKVRDRIDDMEAMYKSVYCQATHMEALTVIITQFYLRKR